MQPPSKSFATLGDAVKIAPPAPKTTPPKTDVATRPISDEEALEFVKEARLNTKKTYAELAIELHGLGYRQSDGRPWCASHLSAMILERYPELRQRQPEIRRSPRAATQIVNVHPQDGRQGPAADDSAALLRIIKRVRDLDNVDANKKLEAIEVLVSLL